jgi:hypothetical protein
MQGLTYMASIGNNISIEGSFRDLLRIQGTSFISLLKLKIRGSYHEMKLKTFQ